MGFSFPPDAGECGLDFGFEAGDEFAVGGNEGLLGFDFGDYVFLNVDQRKRNLIALNNLSRNPL